MIALRWLHSPGVYTLDEGYVSVVALGLTWYVEGMPLPHLAATIAVAMGNRAGASQRASLESAFHPLS
jgi:hypothetical protein